MGILGANASKTRTVAQPEKEFNPNPSAKESTYSKAVAQYAEDVGVVDSKMRRIQSFALKVPPAPSFFFEN